MRAEEHSPALRLKRYFQSELDQPWVAGGGDLSKLQAGGVAYRVVELRVIEQVEEIDPEKRVHAFSDLGGLLEGHVEVGNAGAAADGALGVAVGAEQRLSGEVIDGIRVERKSIGVEIVSAVALGREGLERLHLVGLSGRLEEVARVQLVVLSAGGDANREAGLQGEDARHGPAVEQEAFGSFVLRNREFPVTVDDQTLTRIELGEAVAQTGVNGVELAFEARALVEGLGPRISHLELESPREMPLHHRLERVVVRVADGVLGKDAGEDGDAVVGATGPGERL